MSRPLKAKSLGGKTAIAMKLNGGICLVFAFGWLMPLIVFAQDNGAKSLLDGVLAARLRISKYHCILTGSLGRQLTNKQQKLEIWKIDGSIRCDLTLDGVETKVLLLPDDGFVRIRNSDVLRIDHAMGLKYANWIQLESLGLGLYQEIEKCYSAEQIIRALQRNALELLPTSNRNVVMLKCPPQPRGEVRSFKIDPKSGFAAIECKEERDGQIREIATVSWGNQFGYWVPTYLNCQREGLLDREFNVEWKSINGTIDAAIFDPQQVFKGSKFIFTKVGNKVITEEFAVKLEKDHSFPNRGVIILLLVCTAIALVIVLRRIAK